MSSEPEISSATPVSFLLRTLARLPPPLGTLVQAVNTRLLPSVHGFELSLQNHAPALYLADKTGVPPLVWGVAGTVSLLLLARAAFNAAAGLAAAVIGFVYPAYASFKAIESPSKDDDTQWTTYWVVFGCFSVIDQGLHAVVRHVPFYHSIKIAFLLWCFLPSTRGADFIYRRFLRPLLRRNEDRIDGFIRDIEKRSSLRLLDTDAQKSSGSDSNDNRGSLSFNPSSSFSSSSSSSGLSSSITLSAQKRVGDDTTMEAFTAAASSDAAVQLAQIAGAAAAGFVDQLHTVSKFTTPRP